MPRANGSSTTCNCGPRPKISRRTGHLLKDGDIRIPGIGKKQG